LHTLAVSLQNMAEKFGSAGVMREYDNTVVPIMIEGKSDLSLVTQEGCMEWRPWPAPLLGWVGGKAWRFASCTTKA
jgi:hypothetical protein